MQSLRNLVNFFLLVKIEKSINLAEVETKKNDGLDSEDSEQSNSYPQFEKEPQDDIEKAVEDALDEMEDEAEEEQKKLEDERDD